MSIEIAVLILGLAGAFLAWRELAFLPQKARQDILDRLREPPATGLQWGTNSRSEQEQIDEIVKSGMAPSELESRFALPRRHLWRSVRQLYEVGKIEVFLLEASVEGNNANVPAGAKAFLPIFIRGALPPDLRPDRGRVEGILRSLQ